MNVVSVVEAEVAAYREMRMAELRLQRAYQAGGRPAQNVQDSVTESRAKHNAAKELTTKIAEAQ
jgi:hypothetical protein